MSYFPRGVFPATLTPFDSKGALDLATLDSQLRYLADAGVDGFVPCGTTGETSVLSASEREAVLKATIAVARERGLKVIAGCGGNNTAAVLELIHQVRALGADAALVVTPYYNKPTPRGLQAHFEVLAQESKFPIVLYNVPGRTAVALPPETTAKLFQQENIVGIKEATGLYSAWIELASAMDVQKKALLAGDDDAFAVIQSLGGSGIISASANVAPHAFVQLYKHTVEGNWPAAFALQKKLLPLVRALFAETSPAPAKRALELMGRGTSYVRLPLVEVTDATSRQLEAALKGLELL